MLEPLEDHRVKLESEEAITRVAIVSNKQEASGVGRITRREWRRRAARTSARRGRQLRELRALQVVVARGPGRRRGAGVARGRHALPVLLLLALLRTPQVRGQLVLRLGARRRAIRGRLPEDRLARERRLHGTACVLVYVYQYVQQVTQW